MKKSILRTILAIVALATSSVTISAHDFLVDSIYYNITSTTDMTCEVTYYSYDEYTNDVVIPDNVTYQDKTYRVTSIGITAFSNCEELTSVTIPNSVTTIGYRAFANCTGLTEITIPNSVTSIGQDVFEDSGWYNNQPNGVLYLDNCCLGYKGDKPSGTLILNDDTRLIAESAFSGCTGLTELTIPDNVITIGQYAFSGCTGLTSVTIGTSVTEIGFFAFKGCTGLTEVVYNAESCSDLKFTNCFSDGPLFQKLTIGDNVKTIPDYAFCQCTGLTELTIPDSVTVIGLWAFYGCSGLTELTIGNNVNEIGDGAFEGCRGLTELTIPGSVTSIGHRAFYGCAGLTELTIPDSVTEIGGGAFCECSGLTNLTLGSKIMTFSEKAFYGCTALKYIVTRKEKPAYAYGNIFSDAVYNDATLYIPTGSLYLYQITAPWNNFLTIQEMDMSRVESTLADNDVAVSIENGNIVVSGAADNVNVEVYSMNGQCVYCGNATTIPVTVKGLYIVKVNNKSFKVIL